MTRIREEEEEVNGTDMQALITMNVTGYIQSGALMPMFVDSVVSLDACVVCVCVVQCSESSAGADCNDGDVAE